MDIYFEAKGASIPTNDNSLVAACALLLGAKTVELDDRIPFISKLKKYTSVYANRDQFKYYEVDIAETMNWDLQKLTFYDYIEHFLNKGVVCDDDKVFNKLLNAFSTEDTSKVAEIISRMSGPNSESENDIYGATKGKWYGSSSKNAQNEDACGLIKNFNKMNLKDSGVTDMKYLGLNVKENVLVFFENYIDLISETLQKSYAGVHYDKKKLAICVILFARSSIFNGANTWNLRLEEITEMHLSQIRDCFSSICQFFSYSKSTSAQKPAPQATSS